MPGMPGRSGGANRLTAEAHRLRGTFRPSRHGGKVVPMRPDDAADGWKPTAADFADLGKAGRRFVHGWLHTYSVSRAEGMVLMQAAVAHDRLATLRSRDRSTLSAREDRMVQRLELNWSKLLAGLLAQLRIQR
jgi:hypothetical protein